MQCKGIQATMCKPAPHVARIPSRYVRHCVPYGQATCTLLGLSLAMISAAAKARQGLQAAQAMARSLAILMSTPGSPGGTSFTTSSINSDAWSPSGVFTPAISSSTQYRVYSAEASRQEEHASSTGGDAKSKSAEAELRSRLLEAALKHVPTHGWSQAALNAAAADLRLSPAVTGVLQRREGQLVEFFIAHCNRELAAQLAERKAAGELATLRTRGTLALAVKLRLQMLVPVLDSWPQALAVATHPRNAPHALALLGQLVDEIWAAAGDTSTDMSWYTRRALLAGVYTSTELYMLTDFSPEFADTWQALERRLDDVLALGKLASSAQAQASGWASAAARAAAGGPSKMAAAAAEAASQASGAAASASGSGEHTAASGATGKDAGSAHASGHV